jgi:hypothetical protein
VARICFGLDFVNKTGKPPVNYDMQTRLAHLFGSTGRYLQTRQEVYDRIRRFVETQKGTGGS